MELFILLTASLCVALASFSGVLFTAKHVASWTESRTKYLIAFASGVFVVIFFNLVAEAYEFSHGIMFTIASVLAGYFIFYIGEKLYPDVHCHHTDQVCLAQKTKRGAHKVLYGDALHNIGDGILLAATFAVDIRLGFIAVAGIFIHEVVQEIAEFFVLKNAGYTTKQALIRNGAVAATVFIGALGGYYIASFDILVAPLIGLSAGAFLYILVSDLIPESVRHSRNDKSVWSYLGWALVGIILVLLVNIVAAAYLEKQGLDGHGHLPGEHGLELEYDDHDHEYEIEMYGEHTDEHDEDAH